MLGAAEVNVEVGFYDADVKFANKEKDILVETTSYFALAYYSVNAGVSDGLLKAQSEARVSADEFFGNVAKYAGEVLLDLYFRFNWADEHELSWEEFAKHIYVPNSIDDIKLVMENKTVKDKINGILKRKEKGVIHTINYTVFSNRNGEHIVAIRYFLNPNHQEVKDILKVPEIKEAMERFFHEED